MKNALEIIQSISYSSNTEVSKATSFAAVKKESINGLNRAIRVLYNSKEWGFRRNDVEKYTINTGVNFIKMPNALIAQEGIKLGLTPLLYDKDIPFYDEKIGEPEKYYINSKDHIIFYPQPDKDYIVNIDSYCSLPVIGSDGELKREFAEETDILNIKERLEDLFLDCLSYFCNEILNGDPTDEEYQEHKLRYSEVYKLLEKADTSSFDNDDSKGFILPWQQ